MSTGQKRSLSLIKGKQRAGTSTQRFAEVTNKSRLDELAKGYVPANTEKNIGRAIGVYEQWKKSRKDAGSPVPDVFLPPYNFKEIAHWLAVFVTEESCWIPVSSEEFVSASLWHSTSFSEARFVGPQFPRPKGWPFS